MVYNNVPCLQQIKQYKKQTTAIHSFGYDKEQQRKWNRFFKKKKENEIVKHYTQQHCAALNYTARYNMILKGYKIKIILSLQPVGIGMYDALTETV